MSRGRRAARRLDETVRSLKGTIRVGAATAYVWCGDASEWDGPAVDRLYLGRMRATEASLAARLRKYPVNGSRSGRKVLEDGLKEVRARMAGYVPFGERKVLDVWPSIMIWGTTCIKVEGDEVGPYWDETEVGNPPAEDDIF